MLPVSNRVRISKDFARTVRSGARSGRRNVVLYGIRSSELHPSRVGFIVGKNVGNAVVRNLVKRRLRGIATEWLAAHPVGYDVVVRALPGAADSDYRVLHREFFSGTDAVERKLARADPPNEGGGVS